MFFRLALLPLTVLPSLADVITGIPDSAPPGYEQWVSPVVVPAKNVTGSGDWTSAVRRARATIAKLTLEEKVNATTGQGLFGRCVGNTGSIPSINWPGLCLEDGPLGVRFADGVSAFPAAINAAATWDKSLIEKRAQAMGAEFRGKGVNVALAPMMNLARAPEAGRNWEGFGGDPFLSGIGAALTTKGIQSNGVMATPKHFIGNEQEHFRGGSLSPQISSSDIDDKTMHEVWLWPFAEAVNAGSVAYMCSYQKVNQTQACQNSKMINGLLKEELDFQGFIMSDWAAMLEGVQPALAGLDMNMPGFKAYGLGDQNQGNPAIANNSFWGAALVEAVNNGSVPVTRLNDMVTRIFAAYYKLGQDSNYPAVNFDVNARPGLDEHIDVQGDHKNLIRQIDGASAVLLKNAGILPLNLKGLTSIGVFGSDAGPNPAGPNSCSDRNCNHGTLAMGWGSGTANFPYLVDPLAALNSYVASQKSSVTINNVTSDSDYDAITAAASNSSVCLVFVSADSGEGYITVEGNAGDRNDLNLWHNGDTLITKTADVCNNTVVVAHTVGAVITEAWIEHPNVKAVLFAGLPGQESGNGLVDVLFGAVNPSARLPYTVAKARSDYPADVIYTSSDQTPQIVYSEGGLIDYRWFDAKNIEPRFEFGFGLSYTTFKYSNLHVGALWTDYHSNLYSNAVAVTYMIQNTGNHDGSEVSQVYLGFPASANQPPRVLRGFEKTFIKKKGTTFVTTKLRVKDISYWDVTSQKWAIPSGKFQVYVGSSSRNIQLTGSFTRH